MADAVLIRWRGLCRYLSGSAIGSLIMAVGELNPIALAPGTWTVERLFQHTQSLAPWVIAGEVALGACYFASCSFPAEHLQGFARWIIKNSIPHGAALGDCFAGHWPLSWPLIA